MRRNAHALVHVEAMRVGPIAGGGGVEVELTTLETNGFIDHPVEQEPGMSGAPVLGPRRQIVAVQRVTPGEMVDHTEARRGGCLLVAIGEGGDQSVSLTPLAAVDDRNEILRGAELRAECQQSR